MKTILRVIREKIETASEFTTAPVEAARELTSAVVPEFIRLPRPGSREPFTGLSRSKLNELVLPMGSNDYTDENGSVVVFTFDALCRKIATAISLATGVGGTTAQTFQYDGLFHLT
jgi:hypothetical protein